MKDGDKYYRYLGSDIIYNGSFDNILKFPKSEPRKERYPKFIKWRGAKSAKSVLIGSSHVWAIRRLYKKWFRD